MDADIVILREELVQARKDAELWKMRWERQHENTIRWMEAFARVSSAIRGIMALAAAGAVR